MVTDKAPSSLLLTFVVMFNPFPAACVARGGSGWRWRTDNAMSAHTVRAGHTPSWGWLLSLARERRNMREVAPMRIDSHLYSITH